MIQLAALVLALACLKALVRALEAGQRGRSFPLLYVAMWAACVMLDPAQPVQHAIAALVTIPIMAFIWACVAD